MRFFKKYFSQEAEEEAVRLPELGAPQAQETIQQIVRERHKKNRKKWQKSQKIAKVAKKIAFSSRRLLKRRRDLLRLRGKRSADQDWALLRRRKSYNKS